MTFNSEQEAIFEAAKSSTGNMMVEALPGTGKSTVLIELPRYLKGTVFLCAFGKNAANHLINKATPIYGDELKDRIKIQTTHGLGFGSWLRASGFGKVKLENSKVRLLCKEVGKSQPLAAKYSFFIAKLVGYAKRAGFGVLSSIENHTNWMKLVEHHGLEADLMFGTEDLPAIIGVAVTVYVLSLKQCSHTVDFDDQILAPMYYGTRFVRYDNVLVDEAQDTSPLRLHMLFKLVKSAGRMIAVGDSNQAVMGFSGASVDSMAEIKTMTDPEVFQIHTSYRLPQTGAAFASAFAPGLVAADHNVPGIVREVWLETSKEAPTRSTRGLAKPDFWACAPFTANDAILCRSTRPLVALAFELIRRQIPCRVEGRDIGKGLIQLAGKWRTNSIATLEERLTEWSRKEVSRLTNLMQDQAAERVQDQCDTLQTLIAASHQAGKFTVPELVATIESIFGDTPEGEAPDMCVLSTVHKAKGREWPRVFVLGYHQYMPSRHAKKPWEQTEERNLQFIAITRHMRELILVNMPETKPKRRGSH